MKLLPTFKTERYRKAHKNRQRYRLALICLAVLVASATGYALIHPAITMTAAAHRHDASCYTQVTSSLEQALHCTFAQEHADDTACIVHLHDQTCYDDTGALVCTLVEVEAHTHTEACHTVPEAHTHSEDCYERQQGDLICGEEETEEHQHTDNCYVWADILVCGLDESAPAEPVLICEKPEIVLHTHTETCFGEDGTLRCDLPQILLHQHGPECFETIAVPADTQTLTCTNTAPEHVHSMLCYGIWELTCGLTEDAPTDGDEDAAEEPVLPETPANPEEPDAAPEDHAEPEEEPAEDTPAEEDETQTFRLGYYRICDGKPLLVKEESTVRATAVFGRQTRYYVTASELEAVYGAFGFERAAYSGELLFPHTDSRDASKLWADCAPVYDAENGEWRIPLSEQGKSDHSYVYYLPANTKPTTSLSDTEMLTANTFYTITVTAPAEFGISKTGVYEVLTGQAFEIELPAEESYVWKITDLNTGKPLEPAGVTQLEQSVVYFFKPVTCPIRIAAVKDGSSDRLACTIRYTADTLSAQLQRLSSIVTVAKQYIITNGTVGGLTSLDEQVDLSLTDTHTLRWPDDTALQVGESDNTVQSKVYFYHFTGWRIKGREAFFPAGTPVSASELAVFDDGSGVIELEAVWTPFDARGKIPTVNFYLCLTCEIMDSRDNGFKGNPATNFTQSLFTAKVFGTDENTQVKEGYMPIAEQNTANGAYNVDAQLRTLTQTAYDGISLSAFPSDEEVFAAIRADGGYSITIDGKSIPAQNLTTDYFKVRWYVLKYHDSDGWHIDGVLVAKQAQLRVTKSFLGDADAIAQIKNQTDSEAYRIQMDSVHPQGGQEVAGDTYYLTLNERQAEDTDSSAIGYDTYDATTDTYTWIVTGRIDGLYSFEEQNYLPPSGSQAQCASYCRVSDAPWQTGSTVSGIRMQSYPQDQPASSYQTVSFRNYYIQPNTLTLHKIDAFTNLSLANIRFSISRTDQEQELILYRKPGTGMYSYLSGNDYSEPAGNRIVTDANGDLFLSLEAGSYVLEEEFPTGYSGAARIAFTVDENCRITAISSDGPSGSVSNTESSIMVRNQSHLLTSVTAVKDWGSTPEDRREPVVVTLLCGGVPLSGTEYTQTLSSSNSWTYQWPDLPLFMNGKLAEYTLHEAMIGGTTYDKTADPSDGYANYQVTYDAALYSENGGPYTSDAYRTDETGILHYADHVLLTVHNRLDGNSGQIRVSKQFQNAAGEHVDRIEGTYTFGLYEEENPSGTPLMTASIVYRNGTSIPEDGIARFDGLKIGGSYHVYELDSSGRPILDGSAATIGGKPFLVSGSGVTVTVSQDAPTGEVTVTNCAAYPALPMTGGTGAEPFLLAGGLLSACAAAALALRRRRTHLSR